MKTKTVDIKAKTIQELEKEIQMIRSEIAKLSVESKVNTQKDTNLIQKKRKTLARLLTSLRLKQIQAKSEIKVA